MKLKEIRIFAKVSCERAKRLQLCRSVSASSRLRLIPRTLSIDDVMKVKIYLFFLFLDQKSIHLRINNLSNAKHAYSLLQFVMNSEHNGLQRNIAYLNNYALS